MPQKNRAKLEAKNIAVTSTVFFIKTLPIWAGIGIFSPVIYFAFTASNSESAHETWRKRMEMSQDLRSEKFDGVNFSLSDAHQVTTNDGRIGYNINFRSETVVIDGPGENDDVRLFSEFNGNSFIEDARVAGVDIANKILQERDALKKLDGEAKQSQKNQEARTVSSDEDVTDSIISADNEVYVDLLSDAQVFLKYYDGSNYDSSSGSVEEVAPDISEGASFNCGTLDLMFPNASNETTKLLKIAGLEL